MVWSGDWRVERGVEGEVESGVDWRVMESGVGSWFQRVENGVMEWREDWRVE